MDTWLAAKGKQLSPLSKGTGLQLSDGSACVRFLPSELRQSSIVRSPVRRRGRPKKVQMTRRGVMLLMPNSQLREQLAIQWQQWENSQCPLSAGELTANMEMALSRRRRLLRPGYSARRYLANWASTSDQKLIARLTTHGSISESTLYENSSVLPHLRRRIDVDLSARPQPYRIPRAWLSRPFLIGELTAPSTAGMSTRQQTMLRALTTIDMTPLVDDAGDVRVFQRLNGDELVGVEYSDLSHEERVQVLSDLLLQSAVQLAVSARADLFVSSAKELPVVPSPEPEPTKRTVHTINVNGLLDISPQGESVAAPFGGAMRARHLGGAIHAARHLAGAMQGRSNLAPVASSGDASPRPLLEVRSPRPALPPLLLPAFEEPTESPTPPQSFSPSAPASLASLLLPTTVRPQSPQPLPRLAKQLPTTSLFPDSTASGAASVPSEPQSGTQTSAASPVALQPEARLEIRLPAVAVSEELSLPEAQPSGVLTPRNIMESLQRQRLFVARNGEEPLSILENVQVRPEVQAAAWEMMQRLAAHADQVAELALAGGTGDLATDVKLAADMWSLTESPPTIVTPVIDAESLLPPPGSWAADEEEMISEKSATLTPHDQLVEIAEDAEDVTSESEEEEEVESPVGETFLITAAELEMAEEGSSSEEEEEIAPPVVQLKPQPILETLVNNSVEEVASLHDTGADMEDLVVVAPSVVEEPTAPVEVAPPEMNPVLKTLLAAILPPDVLAQLPPGVSVPPDILDLLRRGLLVAEDIIFVTNEFGELVMMRKPKPKVEAPPPPAKMTAREAAKLAKEAAKAERIAQTAAAKAEAKRVADERKAELAAEKAARAAELRAEKEARKAEKMARDAEEAAAKKAAKEKEDEEKRAAFVVPKLPPPAEGPFLEEAAAPERKKKAGGKGDKKKKEKKNEAPEDSFSPVFVKEPEVEPVDDDLDEFDEPEPEPLPEEPIDHSLSDEARERAEAAQAARRAAMAQLQAEKIAQRKLEAQRRKTEAQNRRLDERERKKAEEVERAREIQEQMERELQLKEYLAEQEAREAEEARLWELESEERERQRIAAEEARLAAAEDAYKNKMEQMKQWAEEQRRLAAERAKVRRMTLTVEQTDHVVERDPTLILEKDPTQVSIVTVKQKPKPKKNLLSPLESYGLERHSLNITRAFVYSYFKLIHWLEDDY